MTLHEKLQAFGRKAEYYVYRTAWLWMLFFILAVISLAVYIKINVWYECRSEHSFFYCLALINS